jgi:hypothetical protein
MGAPARPGGRRRPELLEELRAELLAGITAARKAPLPEPIEH